MLLPARAGAAVGDIDRWAGGGSGDNGAATAATTAGPSGLARAADGDLLILETDHHRIRRVDETGVIATVAGDAMAGFTGDGGQASRARLNYPAAMLALGDGTIIVADTANHRIRRIDPSGMIETIAGTTEGFAGDGGPAVEARLAWPGALAYDVTTGAILVADGSSDRVRKITADGIISTVAGNGLDGSTGDGGLAVDAQVASPSGVAIDAVGNIYISQFGHHRIRRVDPSGVISTYAGDGTPGFSGDGGPASAARISTPMLLSLDEAGRLIVADAGNNRIRAIDTGGAVSTIAGSGSEAFSGDGGQATAAGLSFPKQGLANAAEIVIADTQHNRVRSIDRTTGIITTIAGTGACCFAGDGLPPASSSLFRPTGTVFGPDGRAYIADTANHRIRMVGLDGLMRTIAGTGTRGFSGDGGAAMSARISEPRSVAVDRAGNVIFSDTGNNRIRRIDAAGVIRTIVGNGSYGFRGDGGAATSASLSRPRAITLSSGGILYFTDSGNRRLRRVRNGVITTVAGGGTTYSDGVSARAARFSSLMGVAVDRDGSFLVADRLRNRIRRIRGGIVTTFAWIFEPQSVVMAPDGSAIVASTAARVWRISTGGVRTVVAGRGVVGYTGDGGPASRALIGAPNWASVSPSGDIHITDVLADRIRRVDL